jgi:hypothetical protein
MSIAMVNQQLKWHKIICIKVSLDTYVIDLIPLNTFSRMKLFPNYVKSRKNIVDLLTKDLSRKLLYNSSMRMSLASKR